ncbi:hypothetical protein [Polyangium aurulentum]|uniref:hypothetical protein n=1 Tax=Polyangium aurulentum TaxID=2567896 RepID=UPI0010AEC0DA|nr:hypothetical protein [Polyangium aurulentum]UQA55424.1 hypothetical protein E8A73_029245 [Polyangium aurulentum]
MKAAFLFVLLALLLLPSRAAAQALYLPEPTTTPRRVIEEQGPSPLYYRRSPRYVLPILRSAIGAQGRIATGDLEGKFAFTFDVDVGMAVRFTRGARVGAMLEGGYSYVGFSEHLANLGLGLIVWGLGSPILERYGQVDPPGPVKIALVPHALLGSAYGGTAYGARTSLMAIYWVAGFELAHQILVIGQRQVHEIHTVLTFATMLGEDEE